MHYLHSRGLQNSEQYGFTPQKSTIDAVMKAKMHIESILREKKLAIILGFDVRGAFDAAWWPGIINSLRELNCPKNLFNLAKDYFNNRLAFLKTSNQTIESKISKGCPQGSCCGPVFWNIQYDSLLNENYYESTKVLAFADDLLLIVKGSNVLEVENYANVEVHKVTKWANKNKVQFNPEKSSVMLITKKRTLINSKVNIYMNNSRLNQTTHLKYLGIITDNRFKFSKHIEHVTEKAFKIFNILIRSAKIKWGIQRDALSTIYNGAILPFVLYGVPVWESALNIKRNQDKYKRIQRIINIKMIKSFKTISYEASCVISGQTPILLKAKEISSLYKLSRGLESRDFIYDAPCKYKD